MSPALIESISNRTGDGSYRRGVSQALVLAADLIKQGCTWQGIGHKTTTKTRGAM